MKPTALSIGAYIISNKPPSPTIPFHKSCIACTGSVNTVGIQFMTEVIKSKGTAIKSANKSLNGYLKKAG